MSRLSRSSSGAGYYPHPSNATPGATSVWVGSPPATQNTHQLASQMPALRFSSDKDSNPRHHGHVKHQNSLGTSSSDDVNNTSNEGQYFLVSVRESTSSGDGDSGYNESAVFSPRSPNDIVSPSGKGNNRSSTTYFPSRRVSTSGRDENNSSTVYSPRVSTQSVSPSSTGNVQMNHYALLPSLNSSGSMESQSQTQFYPSYLQPGTGVGGAYSNTGSNMYGGSGFLPAAGGVSFDPSSSLPQHIYDPNALASQFQTQPFTSTTTISPELLVAFGQHGLNDSQALLSSLTYLNQLNQLSQPVDVNALAAAMVANQSMMAPLQSPTSPLFMSPTLTSMPFSSATFTSMPFSSATFTSPLPSVPLSTPTWTSMPLSPTSLTSPLPVSSPMFTGVSSPLVQSSLYLNSQAGLANCYQPQVTLLPHSNPVHTHGVTATGQVVTRKRSNLSNTGSFDDQATSGLGSSVPSTPSDSSPTSPRYEHCDHHPLADHEGSTDAQFAGVPPCYDPPADKNSCMRCGKKVYAMEKLGPVKDVLYHKTCFTCAACHTTLTLQNFQHSDADMADLHVYCQSHKPAARANPVDACAVGIQRALTVPKLGKINDQIRGGPEASKHVLDTQSVSIRAAMAAPAPTLQTSIKTREGHTAWFRQHRQSERMPPQDVVKHDGKDQRYEGSRSLYINTTH